MKSLLLLSLFITLTTPALARIGETREQCDARYGKPVEVRDGLHATIYNKAGLIIACVFHEDKCEYIEYATDKEAAGGRPLTVSDTEKKVLMEANSNGSVWTNTRDDVETGLQYWTWGTLKAVCTGNPTNNIGISTPAYRDRNDPGKAKLEKEKGKLKDF